MYNIFVDPINPIAGNPEAVNLADPERPKGVEGQAPKDPHGITIAAMAIFVLLALAAVAFLYYQNQQLKSMLASYQTQATPTPSATTDPTVNWKTYDNQVLGLSFKYPEGYTLEEKGQKDYINLITNPNDPFKDQIGIDGQSITSKMAYGSVVSIQKESLKNIQESTSSGWLRITGDGIRESEGEKFTIAIYKLGNNAIKMSTISIDPNVLQNFGQILSTFKFTGPTASPSAKPVACTQEAKLCPNGTYVGRTGPNCEFAPCPTP